MNPGAIGSPDGDFNFHSLLLACARAALGIRSAAPVRDLLLSRPVDWDRFLTLARRHAAEPLVCACLSDSAADLVPELTLSQLRERQKSVLSRNLQLMAELLNVVDLFRHNQTPLLAYKGPVLATTVYRNLSHRASLDLDLLIRPGEVDAAAEFLSGAGYRMSSPMAWKQRKSAAASPELLFMDPGDSIPLDLHWSFVPSYYPFPLDPAPLWERAASITAGGRKILVFSPEDLLLVLCVHGAKHLWNRLRWVCDVAKLVHGPTGLDWDRALEHARQQRCERTVLIGVGMAHNILGASLPANILERLRRDHSLGPAVAAFERRLFTGEAVPVTGWEFCRYAGLFAPNWRVKLRFWLGVAAVPKEADSAALRFPGFLGGPIRLARLALKHFGRPARNR